MSSQDRVINWDVLGTRVRGVWYTSKDVVVRAGVVAKEEVVRVGVTTGKGFSALKEEYKGAYGTSTPITEAEALLLEMVCAYEKGDKYVQKKD